MQSFEDSQKLAEALVKTGRNFNVNTEAVISDMSQPLGKYVGNAFETYECIKILNGETEDEAAATRELSIELSARLLVLAGITDSVNAAREMASAKLANGEAFAKFQQNVGLQGGDGALCDKPESLIDRSLLEVAIKAGRAGIVSEIDTLAIGSAIVEIGGGRTKADDRIDHAVGYASYAKIGDSLKNGETLGLLYCRSEEQADSIAATLKRSYKLGDENVEPPALIKTIIS